MRSALGALAILISSAVAALAAGVGTVIGVSGPCFIETSGNRSPLALGASIAVGDIVDVSPKGKLKLRMSDGSVVLLAAGTRLTITAYEVAQDGKRQEAQLSLAQGLLRAIVAPVVPLAKFEVTTATAAAGARSTDWFVETTAKADRVAVLTGSVEVIGTATGHSVVVPAGRETTVAAGQDPAPPHAMTRAAIASLLARTELPRPRPALRPRNRASRSEYAPPPEERFPPNQPYPAPQYQAYPAPPPPVYSPPYPPPQYRPYPVPPLFPIPLPRGPGGPTEPPPRSIPPNPPSR